ncbi:MAG: UDP-N-acetylglucosamine 4,6-dehydratase (inverting) [Dissulfurimicrobium sp.]|uniref:UDP-N-acetylglucosamine 4,6-dehydratase (inverting) n=1 Tax=Dissulfurimicrobium TaxID=1769732 RepID=UPI001EDAC2C3|nr:UDP-N-acetylglucosamine 4,6-dehydratase (inverting) [Dissulfurimicrobium hydrothermale]UKL12908.1 UDP-N-acetylglucosamine 4,6-dehydratase (inverting) [Dissulfurimicrobium hydrothermale]
MDKYELQNGFEWDDKVILITGGTGSFGKAFVKKLLSEYHPRAIRIYSRDELKQFHIQQEINDTRLRFFIGDVRDKERLIKAARNADVIVHAAAMKQVPACEYNPFEAVKTNIIGATNVIDAALENAVPRVIALSTDKAVYPVNLYGATKLCSDKLFIHSNVYAGERPTRFACVRYGNVLGSRGSVIPVFMRQKENGYVTITDPRMTRFWLTLDQAVNLVTKALALMDGGEIFIPKIPSMKITDLAEAIAPGCEQRITGIRPGEKLHEVLINEDEGRHTFKFNDIFIVYPNGGTKKGKPVRENFMYTSDTNDLWLTVEELRSLLQQEGSL